MESNTDASSSSQSNNFSTFNSEVAIRPSLRSNNHYHKTQANKHWPKNKGGFHNKKPPTSGSRKMNFDNLDDSQNPENSSVDTSYARNVEHNRLPVGKGVKSKTKTSENQRERLIQQLCNGQYECMICYNVIKPHVATISCHKCYHIYHLYCVKQWSRAEAERAAPRQPADEAPNKPIHQLSSWRCPACQIVHDISAQGGVFRYICFCGKQRDPPFIPQLTPHSCGELCTNLRGEHCSHPCNILCHPGPCPPCEAFIKVNCACGSSSQMVKCSTSHLLRCDRVCGKLLNCGIHHCTRVCHADDCGSCEVKLEQKCFCSQEVRSILCGGVQSSESGYSCGRICSRDLECGNHKCTRLCHEGPCASCPRLPENVVSCPCGKKLLCELVSSGNPSGDRTSCMDPIPLCSNPCGRKQPLCGHACEVVCHDGDCPSCPNRTSVTCRCGRWTRQMLCAKALELSRAGQDVLCEKVCKKMKTCGVHRCKQACCIDFDHVCVMQCGKLLACGNHTCESGCHQGPCAPCQRMNIQGVSCHCGGVFIPPPLPCGFPPPQCPYPCAREHRCDHLVDHPCHPIPPECPPCTVLMEKLCPGGHTVLNNIPCYQDVVTCGLRCNRPLATCSHLCSRPCHIGENCLLDTTTGREFPCKQPCGTVRPACGHPCGLPCHESQQVSCEAMWNKSPKAARCSWPIRVTCSCGVRVEQWSCAQLLEKCKTSPLPETLALASMSLKDSPDSRQEIYALLECNSTCVMTKRLNGFAEIVEHYRGSGEHGTDSSESTTAVSNTPLYVAFLKEYGAKNLSLVYHVEEEFEKLIRSLYASNKPTAVHHFSPMHFDKRRFIHELSDFYNLASESYGNKPNRSLMVLATRNKSFVPPVKLSTVLVRENPSLKPTVQPKMNPVIVPMSKIESFSSNMTPIGGVGGSYSAASQRAGTSNQNFIQQASESGWWNALEDPDQPL